MHSKLGGCISILKAASTYQFYCAVFRSDKWLVDLSEFKPKVILKQTNQHKTKKWSGGQSDIRMDPVALLQVVQPFSTSETLTLLNDLDTSGIFSTENLNIKYLLIFYMNRNMN